MEYLSRSYRELLSQVHTEDEKQLQVKKILILKFEIVAKVCHFIENFGSFGYSFSKTKQDRILIAEAYRVVSNYDVDAVKSFYERFVLRGSSDRKNLLNLQQIFCYPKITYHNHILSSELSDTLRNLGDIISEIGDCYIDKKLKLIVVRPHIGDIIAYQHGLHFCQEVYPYRNQNKV